MTTGTATKRRGIFAGLIATRLLGLTGLPGLAIAVLAGPPATGANDPCAASEIARTIGSVSKSMGDYLDSHPETNQTMTSMLQQQAGPQSFSGSQSFSGVQSFSVLKSYFEANPKVAGDMTSIAKPLTSLSLQCKLPIGIPQAMDMMQQAQAVAGLPAATPPGATLPGVTIGGTGPVAPAAGSPLSGPPRGDTAG